MQLYTLRRGGRLPIAFQPKASLCRYRKMSSAAYTPCMPPVVPGNSDNQYKQLHLANGMKVTLVSIKNAEKSAASMSIEVGANNDGALAGLAHFTEHAVFLGSEKFQEQNHFKKLLSKNGGRSNGGTSMNMTTFQFEVNKRAYEEVLEVWGQFFVKPLMRDDAILREIQAVTAEDSKNRILDGRRMLQTLKSLIVPSAPYSNFSTGNVQTLAMGQPETHAAELAAIMKEFHRIHYKPASMALALCGPQSLEELRALAVCHFGPIKDIAPGGAAVGAVAGVQSLKLYGEEHVPKALPKTTARDTATTVATAATTATTATAAAAATAGGARARQVCDHYEEQLKQHSRAYPFRPEVAGTLVQLRPTNESLRDLHLLYGIPPMSGLYKADPSSLVGFALSQKGPNSLFAALQDLGWATSVSAGQRSESTAFGIFQIHISLAPDGYANRDTVVKLAHSHVRYLFGSGGGSSKGGVSDAEFQRMWGEFSTMRRVNFSFQEKSPPYGLAKYIATQCVDYPLQDIFSEGWLMDRTIDMDIVRAFSAYLQPERSVAVLRCHADMKDWLPQDDPLCVTAQLAKDIFDVDVNLAPAPLHTPLPAPPPPVTLVSTDSETEDSSIDKEAAPHRANRVELNYGIPYSISPYAPLRTHSHIASLQVALREANPTTVEAAKVDSIISGFPEPNPYICDDLKVATPDACAGTGTGVEAPVRSEPPKLVHSLTVTAEATAEAEAVTIPFPREQVYHSYDQAFRQPRSCIRIRVGSHAGCDSHPVNGLTTSLFNQISARKLYPASEGGLSYGVGAGLRGLSFSVSGYSPKLPQLVCQIVGDFTSEAWWAEHLEDGLVEICKDRLLRGLRSWVKDRPDHQAEDVLDYLMTENCHYLPLEKVALAEEITPSMVRDRISGFLGSTNDMLTYYHGDESMSAEDTVALHGEVSRIFSEPAPSVTMDSLQDMQKEIGWGVRDQPNRARVLPAGTHTVIALDCPNEDDSNSALIVHFQTDTPSPRLSAQMMLLRRLVRVTWHIWHLAPGTCHMCVRVCVCVSLPPYCMFL